MSPPAARKTVARTTRFCDARPAPEMPGCLVFPHIMGEFLRKSFSLGKLRQLCVNTTLSNFVGYLAGSLVTVMTTYESVERRGIRNLFGILPRKIVVVHRLPEWLEWSLAVLLGYLVMELVRHAMRNNKYLRLMDRSARHWAQGSTEQPSTPDGPDRRVADLR